MCEVTSWIPHAVVETLRDRSAQPVIAWLTLIRASIEEYDPLVVVRPPSVASEESESDGAFDEILSQLGKEIYKLDQYQRNLAPSDADISESILNIFDECLDNMNQTQIENETKVISVPKQVEIENNDTSSDSETVDVPFMTSTPVKSATVTENRPPPVPPRKPKMISPSPSIYDDIEYNDTSDSESASTCWSYKECNGDVDADPAATTRPPRTHLEATRGAYAVVWSHSSGYHNSDEIMRTVLSQAQQQATISSLCFDTASEFSPQPFSVYALQEVGDRCDAVADMTPDRPDDGYEPVRDALTDDNIYEEIEYGYSYTDEGCSCGGSIEVESCSMSASSEGVGRESPLYANLRDHDAYAIPPDVIYWKNLLSDPFYNEDEEDEWITPEECEVYSRERRPPLVIPRITQYRAPRKSPRQHTQQIPYPEEVHDVKDHSWNWSPTLDRSSRELERSYSKPNCVYSSPLIRSAKRLGSSTENLLTAVERRRPNYLELPPSSSGDSLDIEIRETKHYGKQERKSRSMMAPKTKSRAPNPSPRLIIHPAEDTIIYEGPIKRTKFLEGGKKSKKNWVECFMTLTPTALRFYKDYRAYSSSKMPKPPSPTMPQPPDLCVGLQNAHVVPCLPLHTRRHSRSLMLTVDHDQFLIQEETEQSAKTLLKAIQTVIYKLGPPMMEDRPSPQCSSSTDLESLGRTPPASRHFPRTKQKAGGSSNEDLSDSTEVSIQRSYVTSKLRKFFLKRPPMRDLIDSGIYKDEPVFGKRLEEVCPTTFPRVPQFVKACIKEIEKGENMGTDGLYRASGNLSQVQKIRLEVDQNKFSVIETSSDIHVLTGSLKLFFRELKEPLIPYTFFNRILAACSFKPREARMKEFRDIVQALPPCNKDTLQCLLVHLLRVTEHSERNRMHTANLAIVFGPTLLWAEKSENIAIDCIQQNQVVDILLNDYKDIFGEDYKDYKGLS